MGGKTKNLLLVAGSFLAVAASGCWIYFAWVKQSHHNVALHQRIGAVMAEETAKALGKKGRILLITIPAAGHPELQTQLEEFRRALRSLGKYKIDDEELDPKGQAKYGLGSGLSARRFVREVNDTRADAVVSFIGTPGMSDDEIASLKHTPKFIAETGSPDDLPKLFEKRVLHVAVVSRFVFPAPGPLKPSTPQEWFDKRYQVIRAEDIKQLTTSE